MARVSIGIHVHAEPEQLHATIASVRANTSPAVELLLLPDGPDEVTKAALATKRDLPQLGTAAALGPPACFNRFAVHATAEVLVLLESGSLASPGWLDYLLAALEADPRNGLAGPSANRAWNEQGAFPHCRGTPETIAEMALAAAQRFGKTWRTLEPLHSLADFCYVVRREVIDAIGAADEGYGLGPCWEMDYNIRAARAGFRGVWACAAFVYRSPFTARRQSEEARYFEASKQRYQDKFCALRLRGERADYEPRCRGENCEHFAPASLIQIKTPLPTGAPSAIRASTVTSQKPIPLVSCIMPTRDRQAFVLQSIRYFQRQDYPERELIIVDDGIENISSQLPRDERIHYVHLPIRQSIGAKRNLACELAQGSIIAHWDDDDWYAPNRLNAQVTPLLSEEANITGLDAGVFFDLARWEFWKCMPDLHRRLFVEDVHGGTLVYQRRIWQQQTRYPDLSLAEDAYFLRQTVNRGARLRKLCNEGLFVYLRHSQNAWSFACGQYLDSQGWQRVNEPLLPPEDRAFYLAHSSTKNNIAPISASRPFMLIQPLVSCIMPTANRRLFVPHAIRYFMRQDYPNCELIVVDDGSNAVSDLIPADPRIHYVQLGRKQVLGAKRNLACEEAKGEIIVHWDDDDWMADWRISYQVESLLKEQADICGLDQLLCFDPKLQQSWQYVYHRGERPWVAGNTLCYTKAFWKKNPFPELSVGEDTRFIWSNHSKRIFALQNSTFYVALIHTENTSPKYTQGPEWQPYPIAEIRKLLDKDWGCYSDLLKSI